MSNTMQQETGIRNAVVERTTIDMGDRGLLTAWLHLDYGDGGHQGFGGFALYLPKGYANHTNKGDFAGHFIFRCMEIAGVENWEKVKGKSIRVKYEGGTGCGSNIIAIGHIVKDDWFSPTMDFENMMRLSTTNT
jgi:hypothetical protein